MRFFSKIVFVWNICFIIAVVLRLVEISKQVKDKPFTGVIGFQPLESTLVILGYTAIFVNLIFVVIFLARYPLKKLQGIPKWLIWCNIILLPLQVYYFWAA